MVLPWYFFSRVGFGGVAKICVLSLGLVLEDYGLDLGLEG